ncbi:MAG: T9SS type A sorting domain-containing protein, partial [Bacteroidetes bacterium]|nr:T9SS type A sorting domain-containing protein [Bacteroidota bacterium]
NILKGIISIPENNPLQVDILDVQGRKVVNKEINCNAGTNVFQMNLNNIETGIYLLQLKTAAGIVSKKMVVVK